MDGFPNMQPMQTTLAAPTGGLAMSRLTSSIGVQVYGIDLREGVDDAVVDALRAVVDQHHVAVLRGQYLSAEQHATVAQAFGPIQASPVQLAAGRQRPVAPVSTIEDTAARPPAGFPWHTDVSWTAAPPELGFLSAVVIPEYGGDTIWASTAAIYDALPADVQQLCEASTVLHAPDASLLASVARHHGTEAANRLRQEHPGAEHPLVQTHPRTGRRSLYLCPLYARNIIGPDEHLLTRLHTMLDDPHVQVRWRWQTGDFVIWDETSTCHRALTDHHPQRRVMRRCVTASECGRHGVAHQPFRARDLSAGG